MDLPDFDTFYKALAGRPVDEVVSELQSEYGVTVEPKGQSRREALRCVYDAVKASGGLQQREALPPEQNAEVPRASSGGESPLSDQSGLYEIRSRNLAGRWRAGRFWGPNFQDVLRSDFTDGEWAALEQDKRIHIRRRA